MPDTLSRLKNVLAAMTPALIALARKVGDDDPDFIAAARALDELTALTGDLQRRAH
jgi:hypothetical protein